VKGEDTDLVIVEDGDRKLLPQGPAAWCLGSGGPLSGHAFFLFKAMAGPFLEGPLHGAPAHPSASGATAGICFAFGDSNLVSREADLRWGFE
jgi:hypothetical protein